MLCCIAMPWSVIILPTYVCNYLVNLTKSNLWILLLSCHGIKWLTLGNITKDPGNSKMRFSTDIIQKCIQLKIKLLHFIHIMKRIILLKLVILEFCTVQHCNVLHGAVLFVRYEMVKLSIILTLFVLNFSEETKKTYIYISCHSSTLTWRRWLKSFLK